MRRSLDDGYSLGVWRDVERLSGLSITIKVRFRIRRVWSCDSVFINYKKACARYVQQQFDTDM